MKRREAMRREKQTKKWIKGRWPVGFKPKTPTLFEVAIILVKSLIAIYAISMLIFWLNNPELTQMQVFLIMIGVG